jgi:DNA polymerase III sliding clamp (beta) subunit (PCNA family)
LPLSPALSPGVAWVHGATKGCRDKQQNTTRHMKIPSVCKIEACCSTDKNRAVLTSCWLNAEKKELVSINGHCMTVMPVEIGEHDATGYVTPESIAMSRKIAGKKGQVEIDCNGALAVTNGPTYRRPQVDDLGTFPRYEQVIPNEDEYKAGFKVAFNVDLLKKISDALGTSGVVLEFSEKDGELHAIRVRPSALNEDKVPSPMAFGVLMPMQLS